VRIVTMSRHMMAKIDNGEMRSWHYLDSMVVVLAVTNVLEFTIFENQFF